MKRPALKFVLGLLALATMITSVGLVAQLVAQAPGDGLAPGEVETVLDLPDGNFPEGIALDGRTIYVGNRRFVFVPEESTFVTSSEILKIAPNGTASLFATFPDTDEFDANGVLGLAIDPDGNVYAALDTRKRASKGVWRIRRDGSMVRLAGSERMEFPNALTFDLAGNLYVTDSEPGEIWRFRPDGTGGPWTRDVLLEPLPFDPLGFPLPGANGIAFFPPNHLYVANTEHGLVLHVSINADGTPSAVELVAGNPVPADPSEWIPDFRLWTADGVAVDENGDVHVAIPGFAVVSELTGLEVSPLVRVDPNSGAVALTSTRLEAFDVPLSLAFGKRGADVTSVFVTNGDLFEDARGPGPGVVKAGIGVRGFLGK
jgi:sugar lactone lactonase YvrE